MHVAVFYLAVVWLAVLLAIAVGKAVRHPDPISRILAVDAAALILIALLLVQTLHAGQTYYLDSALVLALLSFVQTLVVTRWIDERGLFEP